jgi:hypothetical protein
MKINRLQKLLTRAFQNVDKVKSRQLILIFAVQNYEL